ncbi:MAG: acylphosphatase [Myxococcales bacterium]|nr:acylphosphatase [Myxococcales bacterium]|tara:strand:- start:465 stop:752 length:288 start_codon:yes stop_codon:yes gene_type:complete
MSDDRIAIRVFVAGRVQGVFFRACTAKEAEVRGLHGWVRNRQDGRVEAHLEGPRPAVENMVHWCHQGSPSAHVIQVDTEPSDVEGFTRFEITPTV